MNSTQSDQLNRLKAYLTERIEECNSTPDAPWTVGTSQMGVLFVIAKEGRICELNFQRDANFISHARTLAPITYANTLREIEWLEGPIGPLEEMEYIHPIDCRNIYLARLDEILESFKEVLG